MAQNSQGTARRRGPGRPFPKGVSGNPGGRPKVIAEVRELAREQTSRAIAALVEIMEKGQSEAARVAAANALLDRGWGKPVQALEHAGAGGGPIFSRGFFESVICGRDLTRMGEVET